MVDYNSDGSLHQYLFDQFLSLQKKHKKWTDILSTRSQLHFMSELWTSCRQGWTLWYRSRIVHVFFGDVQTIKTDDSLHIIHFLCLYLSRHLASPNRWKSLQHPVRCSSIGNNPQNYYPVATYLHRSTEMYNVWTNSLLPTQIVLVFKVMTFLRTFCLHLNFLQPCKTEKLHQSRWQHSQSYLVNGMS